MAFTGKFEDRNLIREVLEPNIYALVKTDSVWRFKKRRYEVLFDTRKMAN